MTDDNVVVYHNPVCSKSRGALEILGERGVDAEVIEYLVDGYIFGDPPTPDSYQEFPTSSGEIQANGVLRSAFTVDPRALGGRGVHEQGMATRRAQGTCRQRGVHEKPLRTATAIPRLRGGGTTSYAWSARSPGDDRGAAARPERRQRHSARQTIA